VLVETTPDAVGLAVLHGVVEALALHGALPADYPSSGAREIRLKALWAAVHS